MMGECNSRICFCSLSTFIQRTSLSAFGLEERQLANAVDGFLVCLWRQATGAESRQHCALCAAGCLAQPVINIRAGVTSERAGTVAFGEMDHFSGWIPVCQLRRPVVCSVTQSGEVDRDSDGTGTSRLFSPFSVLLKVLCAPNTSVRRHGRVLGNASELRANWFLPSEMLSLS